MRSSCTSPSAFWIRSVAFFCRLAIWVVASALYEVYVSRFGNYGAAWGSLSAVSVMLTWLWLSGLADLLGAQVEDEMDRRRGARA